MLMHVQLYYFKTYYGIALIDLALSLKVGDSQ